MRVSKPKPILTGEEEASLLKIAERLRGIGRRHRFTEDEADTAVAVQRLLDHEEPIPATRVLREIEHDLERRGKSPRQREKSGPCQTPQSVMPAY